MDSVAKTVGTSIEIAMEMLRVVMVDLLAAHKDVDIGRRTFVIPMVVTTWVVMMMARA